MDFLKIAQNYREEALELLTKLLSFESVLDEFKPESDAPFGLENKRALEYILSVGSKAGFVTKNVDNYAGHIEYGDGSEILGILAHLDVVPVNKADWHSDPFKAEIRDGKLYARGSEDDKGPLIAAYIALKMLKDNDIKLNKKVRLIMGCDEESGSRCLKHYFQYEKMPELGFSPDAEFPVIYGEKAMASYDIYLENDSIITSIEAGERYNIVPDKAVMTLSKNLEKEFLHYLKENNFQGEIIDQKYVAYGIASHAMVPQNGLNAIFILFKFLNEYAPSKLTNYVMQYLAFDPYGEKLKININDSDMGCLTQNVALVRLEDKIKFGINYRIPVDNYTSKIAEGYMNSFQDIKGSYVLLGSSTRHYVSKDSMLVQSLMSAYQEITGDTKSEPFTIGGGTYAKFIKNCVAFGPQTPGAPDVCHIANEYIVVEDFIKSIAIYANAIYKLGN